MVTVYFVLGLADKKRKHCRLSMIDYTYAMYFCTKLDNRNSAYNVAQCSSSVTRMFVSQEFAHCDSRRKIFSPIGDFLHMPEAFECRRPEKTCRRVHVGFNIDIWQVDHGTIFGLSSQVSGQSRRESIFETCNYLKLS